MLRRFEIYSLDPGAPAGAVAALRAALRDSPRYIDEVLHSAVGDNLTGTPVQLAWEHAYRSPEAYRRYMVHPFHANILDRYLLADSPERVTSRNDLGLGLAGYVADSPAFALASGIRRLLFLDLAGATEAEVADLAKAARAVSLESGPAHRELAVSVFAENSLASRWYDGESVTARAPRWTHLWEQGFADEVSWRSHLQGDGLLADAERTDRAPVPGVAAVVVVAYRIEVDQRPSRALGGR